MRLQHGVSHQLRRLPHRYPFLQRASIVTTLLALAWIHYIKWGERSIYETHIDSCHWEEWEEWPREAKPHHLVFIADPQLVDPHTYPGRPWPLSWLTEVYTDLYMSRNYRLINDIVDPDTIIFLGDLFDGGREWAPEMHKDLAYPQRKRLEDLKIVQEGGDHSKVGKGINEFVPGEDGRWSKWDNRQWLKDLRRFSQMFYAQKQLYPWQDRQLFAAYDVNQNEVSVQNGANNVTLQEYATAGGRQRRLFTSIPGNHDLGLGPGVQIAVRDRFQSHFGEGNRVDVIGNHTFVSLDTPSLSAHSFFRPDGWESEHKERRQYERIWKPGIDFLDNLRHPTTKAVSEALEEYFPKSNQATRWKHEALGFWDFVPPPAQGETATEADKASSKPNLPVVLLSHVPFFRAADTECGHLRERSKAIAIRRGYQYQNVLTQSLSKDIVSRVSLAAGDIDFMFSGDDHDYCDVTHRFNVETKLRHIREITVKSFSWAMGVRRPGFLLVSLWNPVDEAGNRVGTPLPTIQTKLCLLPDQLDIFVQYAKLLALTLGIVLLDAIYYCWRGPTDIEIPDEDVKSPIEKAKLSLPRYRSAMNGHAKAYAAKATSTPGKDARQRGMSTSNFSHSRTNSAYTGIQRNFNARTRDVSSPGGDQGFGLPVYGAPLIDRAGYFPQVKWTDPGEDSDEEARLGFGKAERKSVETEDSQAKWKWRRRTWIPDKLRRYFREFGIKVLLVGVPAGLYYGFLVRNG